MQDSAIQSRTQLRLNSELEEQRQKLRNFELEKERQRTDMSASRLLDMRLKLCHRCEL